MTTHAGAARRIGMMACLLVGAAACAGGCTRSSRPEHANPAPAGKASATVEKFFGPDLALQSFGQFGFDRVTLVPSDDPSLGEALRIAYPANSASQQAAQDAGTTRGGAQMYLAWRPGPVDDAYLNYYVKLPPGFDFVKGGKLPGLYGGRTMSGGHIPDGTNGFSTRYMWRRQGAGEVYAYLPTSVEYGTSLGRGAWHWPTGAWTQVQQHVRLNDPGQSNGELQVWLDRRLVLDERRLTYRSTTSLRIEGLFFSTFFGGDDRSWATPVDQHIDFSTFTIAQHYVTTTR